MALLALTSLYAGSAGLTLLTAPVVRASTDLRHKQSSERICVEHANAEFKQWRPLQRFTGRRDEFEETFLAIGGLVSDRAAER
jgi:hypothetical protein